VKGWIREGKRIVIYGAGFHTQNLLHVTKLQEAQIVGVSDSDQNKHGTECRGHSVINPEEILKTKPDVILISSRDCESQIYDQLQYMERNGISLVRIYKGSAMSWLFKAQGNVLGLYERAWLLLFGFRNGIKKAFSGHLGETTIAERQRTLNWNVSLPELNTGPDLVNWFRDHNILVNEGGHTIYIPPQSELASLMPDIVGHYPPNSGFKILKDFRGPDEAKYSTARPMDLQITANYIHALGFGPQLWDLCTWKSKSSLYSVFVVDHVSGDAPSREECDVFLGTMKEQLSENNLHIAMPDWADREDFKCPGCNGNLLVSEPLKVLQYIDFQCFTCNAAAWTKEIVLKANEAFYFGDTWLTNKPLYQSVPGSASVGKRNTKKRWDFIIELLHQADVSIRGRLVLDVGCNAGMMLNSSLVEGAAWAIGWDRPAIVPFTKNLLFSLGTTRFNLVGATLNQEYPLENDIPVNMSPMLSEAVIFYFSVHDHIGLLESLKKIPWRVFVYEGHQAELLEDSHAAIEPLLTDKIEIVASKYIDIMDGDADPRPVVILKRME